jgi:hypothetical protein
MKKFILLFPAVFVLSFSVLGQTTATKEANPADVSSVDAIMKAVYEVISGDAGVKRDWDRFRTLFHPSARLIPTGKNPQTNVVGARALTVEEYIQRSGPILERDGFFEKEIARRGETFGNIGHFFSTYAAYRKSTDKDPFMRGINSFQLLNDGKRWWVMTIYWQAESADVKIPKKYLKSKK